MKLKDFNYGLAIAILIGIAFWLSLIILITKAV